MSNGVPDWVYTLVEGKTSGCGGNLAQQLAQGAEVDIKGRAVDIHCPDADCECTTHVRVAYNEVTM